MNSKINSRNTSGCKGVSYRKNMRQWRSTIQVNGKRITLYEGKDFDMAVAERKRAEKEYFKEYAPL